MKLLFVCFLCLYLVVDATNSIHALKLRTESSLNSDSSEDKLRHHHHKHHHRRSSFEETRLDNTVGGNKPDDVYIPPAKDPEKVSGETLTQYKDLFKDKKSKYLKSLESEEAIVALVRGTLDQPPISFQHVQLMADADEEYVAFEALQNALAANSPTDIPEGNRIPVIEQMEGEDIIPDFGSEPNSRAVLDDIRNGEVVFDIRDTVENDPEKIPLTSDQWDEQRASRRQRVTTTSSPSLTWLPFSPNPIATGTTFRKRSLEYINEQDTPANDREKKLKAFTSPLQTFNQYGPFPFEAPSNVQLVSLVEEQAKTKQHQQLLSSEEQEAEDAKKRPHHRHHRHHDEDSTVAEPHFTSHRHGHHVRVRALPATDEFAGKFTLDAIKTAPFDVTAWGTDKCKIKAVHDATVAAKTAIDTATSIKEKTKDLIDAVNAWYKAVDSVNFITDCLNFKSTFFKTLKDEAAAAYKGANGNTDYDQLAFDNSADALTTAVHATLEESIVTLSGKDLYDYLTPLWADDAKSLKLQNALRYKDYKDNNGARKNLLYLALFNLGADYRGHLVVALTTDKTSYSAAFRLADTTAVPPLISTAKAEIFRSLSPLFQDLAHAYAFLFVPLRQQYFMTMGSMDDLETVFVTLAGVMCGDDSSRRWKTTRGVGNTEGLFNPATGDLATPMLTAGCTRGAATVRDDNWVDTGAVAPVAPYNPGEVWAQNGNWYRRIEPGFYTWYCGGVPQPWMPSDSGARNCVQKLTVPAMGNYKLSFDDGTGAQQTGDILFSANEAAIQSELKKLSNLGNNVADFVTVSKSTDFIIEFTGANAGKTHPIITSSVVATRIVYTDGATGGGQINAAQYLSRPASGDFKLTFKAQTTPGIAFAASAATVQDELKKLSTIGNNVNDEVTVTDLGSPWLKVEFTGATMGGKEQELITIDRGTATRLDLGLPQPVSNCKQTLTPPAATYTLSFGGDTTGNLNAGSTANQIETELTGLGSIGVGGVTVTAANYFIITFNGGAAAGKAQKLITGTNGATAAYYDGQIGQPALMTRFYGVFGIDNLLQINGNDGYSDGYSVVQHESVHMLENALTVTESANLQTDYDTKKGPPKKEFVDGLYEDTVDKRAYASTNKAEYFAQTSNAALGSNWGFDPMYKDCVAAENIAWDGTIYGTITGLITDAKTKSEITTKWNLAAAPAMWALTKDQMKTQLKPYSDVAVTDGTVETAYDQMHFTNGQCAVASPCPAQCTLVPHPRRNTLTWVKAHEENNMKSLMQLLYKDKRYASYAVQWPAATTTAFVSYSNDAGIDLDSLKASGASAPFTAEGTTTPDHGFKVDDYIKVTGSTPADFDQDPVQVTEAGTTKTFKYALPVTVATKPADAGTSPKPKATRVFRFVADLKLDKQLGKLSIDGQDVQLALDSTVNPTDAAVGVPKKAADTYLSRATVVAGGVTYIFHFKDDATRNSFVTATLNSINVFQV